MDGRSRVSPGQRRRRFPAFHQDAVLDEARRSRRAFRDEVFRIQQERFGLGRPAQRFRVGDRDWNWCRW